jgi:hypothetical protein
MMDVGSGAWQVRRQGASDLALLSGSRRTQVGLAGLVLHMASSF